MATLYISNKNGNIFSDNFYEEGVGGGMTSLFKRGEKRAKVNMTKSEDADVKDLGQNENRNRNDTIKELEKEIAKKKKN